MKQMMLRSLVVVGILFSTLYFAPVKSASQGRDDAELRDNYVQMPARIQENKKAKVTVRVKNNGETVWSGKGKYTLKVFIVRGPSGSPAQSEDLAPYIELKDDVSPRETHYFTYEIEGPNYTGTYDIEFSMANNNKRFGETAHATIQVYR